MKSKVKEISKEQIILLLNFKIMVQYIYNCEKAISFIEYEKIGEVKLKSGWEYIYKENNYHFHYVNGKWTSKKKYAKKPKCNFIRNVLNNKMVKKDNENICDLTKNVLKDLHNEIIKMNK